jgi:myosin heavy subunit
MLGIITTAGWTRCGSKCLEIMPPQTKGMRNNSHTRDGEGWSQMAAHDRFLELCALSTSGELTEEEQKDLRAHVAECSDCQQALKEFEAAASIGVPLLHSQLSAHNSSEPILTSTDLSEASSLRAAQRVHLNDRNEVQPNSEVTFTHGNGHRQSLVNWNYVWMSFAAALVLAATLGIYSYEFGRHKGQVVQIKPSVAYTRPDTRIEALEQQISDIGHERELLKGQLTQRDGMITELRRQVAEQSATLAEMKTAQTNLEQSLQKDQTDKQQVVQEKSNTLQKLDAAQASLQKTQTELDTLRQQRFQDQARAESLSAQIKELHGQLRDQEQEIAKQQDLLSHDRDIRDLMGARDLYIAEVYDVARDGATQKPYGRVFYTKNKSLIFYAYDLDKEPGAKSASTFQAWGRGGPDRQQVLNLGVFYQDNAGKKRWVLKFDDAQTLEQLDAVFVTVEPNGGSHKPSGKPMLFASLKIDPNHP